VRGLNANHNPDLKSLFKDRCDVRQHAPGSAARFSMLFCWKERAVKVLVQLVGIWSSIADLDGQIEEAAAAHPDFLIFSSSPGAGSVMAPPLLAAFGSRRDRFRSQGEVQSFNGISRR
jgi:hypothetical protein